MPRRFQAPVRPGFTYSHKTLKKGQETKIPLSFILYKLSVISQWLRCLRCVSRSVCCLFVHCTVVCTRGILIVNFYEMNQSYTSRGFMRSFKVLFMQLQCAGSTWVGRSRRFMRMSSLQRLFAITKVSEDQQIVVIGTTCASTGHARLDITW